MGDPMLIRARIVPALIYLFLKHYFAMGVKKMTVGQVFARPNRQTINY
jgi:hypothetical protein